VYLSQGACRYDDKSLTVVSHGTWSDLGPLFRFAPDNVRKIVVNVDQWYVVPSTRVAAALLNDVNTGCRCGGLWASGVGRVLHYCSRVSCPGRLKFGSSNEYSSNSTSNKVQGGIIIGRPMFAVAQRTADTFILGRFDANQINGVINGVGNNILQIPQFKSNGTACTVPVVVRDYCGNYQQTCTPFWGGAAYYSTKSSFKFVGSNYAGPISATASSPTQSGWFNRSHTIYYGTSCSESTKQVSIEEVGTMTIGSTSPYAGEGASRYSRWAGSTKVTGYGAFIDTLEHTCPCGSNWTDGVPRRITQCAISVTEPGAVSTNCALQYWYDNVTFGRAATGSVRQLRDTGQNVTEIGFSSPTYRIEYNGQSAFVNGPFSEKLQMVDTICPVEPPKDNFCGTWLRECNAVGVFADTRSSIVFTDEGAADGLVVLNLEYFNPSTECEASQKFLSIEARGYYSKVTVQNSHPGVLFGYKQLYVTAFDQNNMISSLNDAHHGCPCGGKWVSGVQRVITTCQLGTCNGNVLFTYRGVYFGVPAYGSVKVTGGKLQMTKLSPTEEYMYPIGSFSTVDFPFEREAACNSTQSTEGGLRKSTVCGNWDAKCSSDNGFSDYTVAFYHENVDSEKHSYTMDRKDYLPGLGCDKGSLIYVISQEGSLEITNAQTVASNSIAVKLSPSKMTITLYDDDTARKLQQACPCGQQWVVGQPQVFTGACPADTCSDISWLRQQIGVPVYGSMRNLEHGQLRMTSFDQDAEVGYLNDFTPSNYAFDELETPISELGNALCKAPLLPSAPPSTRSSPTTSPSTTVPATTLAPTSIDHVCKSTGAAVVTCNNLEYDFSGLKPSEDVDYFTDTTTCSKHVYYWTVSEKGLPSEEGVLPNCTFPRESAEGNAAAQGDVPEYSCISLGVTTDRVWEMIPASATADQTFRVTYYQGTNGTKTVVTIHCDQNAATPSFVKMKGIDELKGMIQFQIRSELACKPGTNPVQPGSYSNTNIVVGGILGGIGMLVVGVAVALCAGRASGAARRTRTRIDNMHGSSYMANVNHAFAPVDNGNYIYDGDDDDGDDDALISYSHDSAIGHGYLEA